MLIYVDDNVMIEYNETRKQLMQKWEGFILSDRFRKAIDVTVDFIKDNNVASMISDTNNQKVVKPEDVDYATSALPAMFQNGLKAMAFILPHDVFTKYSLKTFEEKRKHEKIAYFSNINDANEWIDEII